MSDDRPAGKPLSKKCAEKCYQADDDWKPCGGICQELRDEIIASRES